MRLEDLNGRRFGRYSIVELLGRGGMAAVYRAHDTALRRDIALKLLYPQFSGDAALVERFQREAVLAAQLDHPNIVPIYDVGESDDLAYIAMKLLGGQSLADILLTRSVLTLPELVPVIEQIASALDYAHARGIVHRDIKPANILIEEPGANRAQSQPKAQGLTHISPHASAVLTDFGIAKSLDAPSMTGTGVLIGTPDYMAPEQIRAGQAVDGRADIYALGVLVFRCLTGRRPFEGNTQEVLLGHLDGRFSNPSALVPSLPAALDPVIRTAMALRPEERYQTASAFARALRSAAGLDLPTPPPAARYGPDPRAVVPRVAADELTRNSGPTPDAGEPTRRGVVRPVPAQAATMADRSQPATQVRQAAPVAPKRSNLNLILAAVIGLLLVFGATLLFANQFLGGVAVAPTNTPAVVPQETATATATAPVPTSTSAPPATVVPSPTPEPPSPTSEPVIATSGATLVPVLPTNTSIPPTLPPTLPPTATATVPPTNTSVPNTPTPEPPTLTATLTPSPTLEPTLTPTPCAIGTTGGFGMLLDQNERVRTRIGCPVEPEQGGVGTLAEQRFEGGSMLYFQPIEAIYVFIGVGNGRWARFEQDELAQLATPTPAPSPGTDLYIPERGFGLVWAYNAEIRRQLGYAVAPEGGLFEGAYQPYQNGAMLYSGNGLGRGKTLYVLYSDGTFERYDDPNQ